MTVVGLVLAAGGGSRMGTPKGLLRWPDGTPFVARAVRVLAEGGAARVLVVVGAMRDDVSSLVPHDVGVPVEVVHAADWAEGMGASLRAGLQALLTSSPPASPTPASPTPVSPTSVSPTSVSPTSVSPTSVSPTSVSPTSVSPTSVSPTPASPTPASPTSASSPPASPTPAFAARDALPGPAASTPSGFGGPAVEAVVVTLVDTPGVTPDAVRRLAALSAPEALARCAYHGVPGHPVLLGREHWAGVIATAAGDAGARHYLRAHDVTLVEASDVADGTDVDTPEQYVRWSGDRS